MLAPEAALSAAIWSNTSGGISSTSIALEPDIPGAEVDGLVAVALQKNKGDAEDDHLRVRTSTLPGEGHQGLPSFC